MPANNYLPDVLETTEADATNLRILRAQLEHAIAVLVGRPPADFSIPRKEISSCAHSRVTPWHRCSSRPLSCPPEKLFQGAIATTVNRNDPAPGSNILLGDAAPGLVGFFLVRVP